VRRLALIIPVLLALTVPDYAEGSRAFVVARREITRLRGLWRLG